MKMQGINLNSGMADITNIISPNLELNNTGGTSIEELLKQRQCEEIEQIMIDSIDVQPDDVIDDVIYF
jgi:hypothetical protein